MSATPSTMKKLGTPAPDFALPDTAGAIVSKNDFAGSPLLVGFICNHCPFVRHIGHKLGELTAAYAARGIGVVLDQLQRYRHTSRGCAVGDARVYPRVRSFRALSL